MSTRDDRRLTHPLNVGYLVVGLVCVGVAGLWALHASDVVDTAQVGWLLPLTLVVAGAVGLVALAARTLTRSRRDETPEEDPGLGGFGGFVGHAGTSGYAADSPYGADSPHAAGSGYGDEPTAVIEDPEPDTEPDTEPTTVLAEDDRDPDQPR